MKAKCLCHEHMLEVEWEDGDYYVTASIWVRSPSNWMTLWLRVKSAFKILVYGSCLLDDVQIGSVVEMKQIADLFTTAAEAIQKRCDTNVKNGLKGLVANLTDEAREELVRILGNGNGS